MANPLNRPAASFTVESLSLSPVSLSFPSSPTPTDPSSGPGQCSSFGPFCSSSAPSEVCPSALRLDGCELTLALAYRHPHDLSGAEEARLHPGESLACYSPPSALQRLLTILYFCKQWECNNNGTLWSAEAYVNGTISNSTASMPAGAFPFSSCSHVLPSANALVIFVRLLLRRSEHLLHCDVHRAARRPCLPGEFLLRDPPSHAADPAPSVLRLLHVLEILGLPSTVRKG